MVQNGILEARLNHQRSARLLVKFSEESDEHGRENEELDHEHSGCVSLWLPAARPAIGQWILCKTAAGPFRVLRHNIPGDALLTLIIGSLAEC